MWKDIASEGFDELSLIAPDLVQVQLLKAEFDERRKPIHMLVKIGGNQNGLVQISGRTNLVAASKSSGDRSSQFTSPPTTLNRHWS